MNARRAIGTVVLAVMVGGALMAAGAALPLPPLGEPGRLGSWWADRGPAVAAFSVMRLAGLIGAGYLALVGSVALLGALTRWRWTLGLSRLAARPGLMRFLVGGSLVAALSAPAEAAARPGRLLTVTDTGPVAAATGPDPGGATLTVADIGPGTVKSRSASETTGSGPGGAALTVADIGPRSVRPQPAPTAGFDAGDGLTVADLGSEAMQSEPAPTVGFDAGGGFTVADLGSSRGRAQPNESPGAGRRTAEAGSDGSGSGTAAVGHQSLELRITEAGAVSDLGDETWLVEVGDHLWAIAAETVADRTGHTDEESVRAYWQRLIEANRHVVGEDPDLIHPGQVIQLPE